MAESKRDVDGVGMRTNWGGGDAGHKKLTLSQRRGIVGLDWVTSTDLGQRLRLTTRMMSIKESKVLQRLSCTVMYDGDFGGGKGGKRKRQKILSGKNEVTES